jgi:hypothetical protein
VQTPAVGVILNRFYPLFGEPQMKEITLHFPDPIVLSLSAKGMQRAHFEKWRQEPLEAFIQKHRDTKSQQAIVKLPRGVLLCTIDEKARWRVTGYRRRIDIPGNPTLCQITRITGW